ncbi:MAG: DNA mismatch repair endonuclease MutL [Phycisphaerales bacterium]
MPIRPLPQHLVNQIAAGEVVDRPASVVKELVENAIDAGARRVEVRIEGGGCDRIEVSDDGGGIAPEELPLAVAAHATSKIAGLDDLLTVASFGFRGEALASIASVARLRITSRRSTDSAAATLEVDHGRSSAVAPAAGNPGTRVEVERLFGQVPARRKFLRSEPAEAARVSEVLEWLALGHPGVALALWQDGRCSLDLPAVEEPARRVLDVLGDALGSDPLEVDVASALAADRPLHVWGRVGRPERARAHAKGLRLTLNGRPIADRGLMHAVREAYRGLIEPGRTPVGFVGIQIDPREVDVNVHPAKSEVRFRQPSAVHALVHRAVKTALRSADLMPELGGSAGATWMPTGPGGWNLPAPRGAAATFDIGQVRHAMSEPAAPAPIFAQPDTPLPAPVAAPRFLQAGRAWLVTSDAEGLVVVDQHALHERVMFERLREQVLTGSLASQPLLAPRVEAASSMELERLEEAQPLLRRLGYDVRAAGPRSLAVHAEPVFLLERGVDALELLRDWLGREDFRADGDGETLWADVLDMMACKAAVKAGDALGDAEIARLLQQLAQVERSTNCPHGRPTAMRIPWRDLERKFGRSPSVRRPV